ncbi:ABC transporter permease [Sutcliffiella halmapala]|uniref:ABC transporter permease n=1 Tax=Sutcliffiella halmapala TaxID=79882 RepID=UPI000995DC49|nr:ABC transporter permease [Sutcliffiella halmapala]
MKFKDKFQFVQENMRKNRSRVFMTILATAMGCAFLMVLASVGFGLQETIIKDVTENDVVTEVEVYGKEGSGHPDANTSLTNEDVTYFEGIESVKTVVRRKQLENWEASYALGEYNSNAQTRVVDYPSEIETGFTLSEGRMPEASNEVVVGYHMVETLSKIENGEHEEFEGSILGKELTLNVPQYFEETRESKDFTFTIVGVASEPTRQHSYDNYVNISEAMMNDIEAYTGTAYGSLIEPSMPEERINELKNAVSAYSYLGVYANNMEQVQGILDQARDDGYHAYSPLEQLKEINLLFAVLKTGLLFVGTIAVIIASIGIFNTMSMAVTERTQDIGIIKAIGGSPKMIKSLFLMESAYIGIVGALIGTVAAYIISYGVNMALPMVIEMVFNEEMGTEVMLSYIPWSLTVICVGISLIVAILSGLKPAAKATRIDVLKALRRDI